MARKPKDPAPKVKTFTVKKCPFCYTYLAVTVTRCTACGKRIGAVDSSGWARKPFDWKAYAAAAIAIAIFLIYYFWAF
jgi:hypothetical protein